MKFSELKNLSAEELTEKLAESKARLAQLKSTHALSPLENPIEIRNVRREVARIITAIATK
jgi:large subunit ribosomal protein L29